MTAVQAEFGKLNNESRLYPRDGSIVTVKFVLTAEGRISRIESVTGSATKSATYICTSAITNPSPYGPWSDNMKALLGKEQTVTFDFYYQ